MLLCYIVCNSYCIKHTFYTTCCTSIETWSQMHFSPCLLCGSELHASMEFKHPHLPSIQGPLLSITTESTVPHPPKSISTLYEVTTRPEEDICTVSIKSNQVQNSVPVMAAHIQNSPNGTVGTVCVSVFRLLMCMICTVALSLGHITFFTQ